MQGQYASTISVMLFILPLLHRPQPRSTLFPYTTLFRSRGARLADLRPGPRPAPGRGPVALRDGDRAVAGRDRKSTRLNSSHGYTSYAVFCLKTKSTPPVINTINVRQHYFHN